ncbi:hypothetical protein EV356DRAFT_344360 [Viridothelium virens]|uniref:Uncharacterized protein n=1 Tax=Viridothelium virens TaxID=1048519 RepID=A0A6A6GXC5_VIRVR|nr:hypothetical protein EV356DRAFT_344360 [Viridothelium virens]
MKEFRFRNKGSTTSERASMIVPTVEAARHQVLPMTRTLVVAYSNAILMKKTNQHLRRKYAYSIAYPITGKRRQQRSILPALFPESISLIFPIPGVSSSSAF